MCEGPATAQVKVIMGKANDTRHGRRKPAPIRSHPAFTMLVALWFAALLGFGSLFLPVQSLERLADFAPSDAAPLIGHALRLVVAILAGLAGYALGALIARKVAQGPVRTAREEPRARRAPTMRDIEADAPRRPIIAHEELGTEGLGPVPEVFPEDEPVAEELPVPPRYDSPWLADEDGHVWSEELADAPLALSERDILPEGTVPVMAAGVADGVAERPLTELGMVELIERLAHAIQLKQGLARSLPAHAEDMVRRLDADVQASHAAYASLMDISNLKSPASKAPTALPAETAMTFPPASFRRSPALEEARAAVIEPDRETVALRSALETLRRMSGTA